MGSQEPDQSDDVVTEGEMFHVHARKTGDDHYEGFVYLGVEIVYRVKEPASRTPAGIEDFAGIVMRKFARRLAAVLEPGPRGLFPPHP